MFSFSFHYWSLCRKGWDTWMGYMYIIKMKTQVCACVCMCAHLCPTICFICCSVHHKDYYGAQKTVLISQKVEIYLIECPKYSAETQHSNSLIDSPLLQLTVHTVVLPLQCRWDSRSGNFKAPDMCAIYRRITDWKQKCLLKKPLSNCNLWNTIHY